MDVSGLGTFSAGSFDAEGAEDGDAGGALERVLGNCDGDCGRSLAVGAEAGGRADAGFDGRAELEGSGPRDDVGDDDGARDDAGDDDRPGATDDDTGARDDVGDDAGARDDTEGRPDAGFDGRAEGAPEDVFFDAAGAALAETASFITSPGTWDAFGICTAGGSDSPSHSASMASVLRTTDAGFEERTEGALDDPFFDTADVALADAPSPIKSLGTLDAFGICAAGCSGSLSHSESMASVFGGMEVTPPESGFEEVAIAAS